MNESSPQQAAREARARARVHQLRAFYQLLGTALLVIAITFVVNLVATPGHWWFLWVVFGFGVALAFTGVRVFLRGRMLGDDWEERKVREYLDRDSS